VDIPKEWGGWVISIYALCESQDLATARYVGQTRVSLSARLKRHLGALRWGQNSSALRKWLCGLQEVGVSPEIIEIAMAAEDDADAAESGAIRRLREAGCALLNRNSYTPSTRQRLAACAAAGRHPSAREHMKERTLANWSKPEYRQRVIDGLKAAWTDECRAALGQTRKTQWQDPSYRDKCVAAVRAAVATPESKERRHLAALARWTNSEYRYKQVEGHKHRKEEAT
jgi:hypothetical protein